MCTAHRSFCLPKRGANSQTRVVHKLKKDVVCCLLYRLNAKGKAASVAAPAPALRSRDHTSFTWIAGAVGLHIVRISLLTVEFNALTSRRRGPQCWC
jgi:hypothetical protein